MAFARSALVVLIAFATMAHAAPVRPLRLDYLRDSSAAGCPDEASVRSAVAARLGFDPFELEAGAVLRVAVSALPHGFRAEVTLVDEAVSKKTRQLTGERDDCSDLASALPFAISIAVEAFRAVPPPEVVAPEVVEKPVPVQQATPRLRSGQAPVEPPGPAAAAPVVVTAAARPWAAVASVRGSAGFGVAPAPAFALALGAGASHGAFLLGLEARVVFPAGAAVQGGSVQATSLAAELVPCLEWTRLKACALAGGGAFWSWAVNLADGRSALNPLLSLGARLEVSLPLWRALSASLFAELRGALSRVALRVGPDEVWVTPPVSGGAGLAVSADFGARP